jgi:dihydroflavonol-4-reductase
MDLVDSPTTSKILVTGAGGFIGSKLVRKLCERNFQVRTFGRSSSAPRVIADLPVEHVGGDITNFEQVIEAVDGCDVVFHLAGLVSYRKKDIQRQYGVNVVGTHNVMEACLRRNVKRVIHTSSVAAMGIPPKDTLGTEELVYNLQGKGLNYCDTKYEAEIVTQEAFKAAVPVIVLSPGIVFGEGDTHPHHHAIFASMSKGSMIGVPPGGVPFSDINDVVDAHLNAMTMGRLGERYTLVSANLSYRDAAMVFARINQTKGPLFTIPGPLLVLAGALVEGLAPVFGLNPPLTRQNAWLSQHKIFFSSQKAIDELQFHQTPFDETVRRTAPYYLGLFNDQRNNEVMTSGRC